MIKKLAIWLLLLAAIPATPQKVSAQEVKVPAEIKGSIGAWVIVAPEVVSGGKPKWRVDSGLQEIRLDLLFPPELASQARGKVFTSGVAGRFKVELWNAKADVPSDISTCWVVIGNPPVVPPVNPPPGPGPVVNPPLPAPLAGMRVLILEETSPSVRLPGPLSAALRSLQVRSYLDSKTLRGPTGQPEWRNFDPNVPVVNLPKEWQDLRARTNPGSLPWVVIADALGSVVFEGPYPGASATTPDAAVAEALALFKKYGG